MPGPEQQTELVRELYTALLEADMDELARILSPRFVGTVTAGIAAGIGGTHHGPIEMWERCWRRLGRAAEIRIEVDELIPAADGRLLVRGTYRGTGRRSGAELEAAFTHLISFEETERSLQIAALDQLTDSARWNAVLEAEGAAS